MKIYSYGKLKFAFYSIFKMEEKIIINDLILNLKSNINMYEIAICDAENIGIRQIIQQIRDNTESMLYELIKIAKIKGYIIINEKAETGEIETIKNEII